MIILKLLDVHGEIYIINGRHLIIKVSDLYLRYIHIAKAANCDQGFSSSDWFKLHFFAIPQDCYPRKCKPIKSNISQKYIISICSLNIANRYYIDNFNWKSKKHITNLIFMWAWHSLKHQISWILVLVMLCS